MPGLLIPSRRTRTGRPTRFAAANPALDFAFLFNIEETGFSRNAASPYGQRHEIAPRPAANGCNGYGYGYTRGEYGVWYASGSLGRSAGALLEGTSVKRCRFVTEASIKMSMDTDEYTILAVVEHANWMYNLGVTPEIFWLGGTPATVFAHPRAGWSQTYLSFSSDSVSNASFSTLTPYGEIVVPYLVVARFVAGQPITYSAERLGADPVWRTAPNNAAAIQANQIFTQVALGAFPGSIFLGGMSTRLLTDAEISAASLNLGFLFEPEDYYTPSDSGGFDPSHLVGQNSFHVATAGTGAVGVVNLPEFAGTCETQTYLVGKKVVSGSFAMQELSSAYMESPPKRNAEGVCSIVTGTSVSPQGIARRLLGLDVECKSYVTLAPKPLQKRVLGVECGSGTEFIGKRIAASPFSAECSSTVAEDSTAVVGRGMESESETALSLSASRMAASRIATTSETQVDFRSMNEAKAHEIEAAVATGTTQIGAVTARQEVICLT